MNPDLALAVLLSIGATTVVALVGGLLFYLYRNEPERSARRALLQKASVPIASCTEGAEVKLEGTTRSRGERVAALGGPVLYVHTSLLHFFRRKNTDGNISESWRIVSTEESGGVFDLVDETGAIAVTAQGAICLVHERWLEVDWEADSPARDALVQRHLSKGVKQGLPLKIRQRCIVEGVPLSVVGTPTRATDGGVVMAAGHGRRLVIGDEDAPAPPVMLRAR